MDSYRGNWGDPFGAGHEPADDDEDDILPEAPPLAIGQDERRLQVRAYNHWASLLGDRSFPAISDLRLEDLPDFAPNAVLLDFSKGIENPAIAFLGKRLAEECGASQEIRHLSDVPGRSLLSRITDHYMQILANEAPIGFEAEFVNLRDKTILYRGILLPFSDNDQSIGHILGVINWKELVDQKTTDQLLREIDQALLPSAETPRVASADAAALDAWADGPAIGPVLRSDIPIDNSVLDLAGHPDLPEGAIAWPAPAFGEPDEPLAAVPAGALGAKLLDAKVVAPEDMGLGDWLAAAREQAQAALGAEDRTRQALYAAIGRAWDFALAATAAPQEFAELVADSGLTMQERAPLTPVVKLVFGAGYDKTRLTEYATALGHAQRLGIAQGAFAAWLSAAPGGLKGAVREERRLRHAETGRAQIRRRAPGAALARRLRQLAPLPLASLAVEGDEFTVLVARRTGEGVVVLGEVSGDVGLVERAARRILPSR